MKISNIFSAILRFYRKNILNKQNVKYTLSILVILILASGFDLFAWASLLSHHGISTPSAPYALFLTAAYYLLLFSILLALGVFPKIRKIMFLFLVLHVFVFLSDHMYFFQYATFISREGLELFFLSTGETFGFIRDAISFSQFILLCKLLIFSLIWIILFCTVLSGSGKRLRAVSENYYRKINFFISGSFFVSALIIYTITGFMLSAQSVQELRTRGTMASNFYLTHKGILEENNFIVDKDAANLQETYIDPKSVPRKNSNIILIIMDSVRADHLPSYGYGRNTTPFIKSIAGDMIKVNYCYAQANGTTKSFPSILLSKYPSMAKTHKDWGFADSVSKNGYSMAISSSMDLNWAGIIKIFDHKSVKRIFHAGMVPKENHIWGFNLGNTLNYGVDDGFNVAEVRKWIDKLPQPFFLIIHLHTAHYGYIVPPQYEVFKPVPKLPFRAAPPWTPMLNAYDNAIFRVDDAVKELFGIFKEKQLLDNSAIAITADHGEAFDEHPGSYYHQTTVYEEQVRVPLFFYLGENVSMARPLIDQGSKRVTGLIDVIPTLFKAAGLDLPSEFEGVPIWGQSRKSFETMISFLVRKEFGIRKDKWKYIRNLRESRSMLFDIAADPLEKNDISKKHPEVVNEFDILYKSISSLDYNPRGNEKPVVFKSAAGRNLFYASYEKMFNYR